MLRLIQLFGPVCLSLFAATTFGQAVDQPTSTSLKTQDNVVIDSETTFFTKPLDADGYPDYLAFLNEELGFASIPADQNGAVDLIQIFGRNRQVNLSNDFLDRMCQKLKIPTLDAESSTYLSYYEYAQARLKKTSPELSEEQVTARLINLTVSHDTPWKFSDDPEMAAWLESAETKRALARISEMVNRPRYAMPYLVLQEAPPKERFVANILLPYCQQSRELARLLQTQAMLDLGEGRHQEAMGRLYQIHQLARLQTSQLTLIEQLVSIAIEAVACSSDVKFAQSPGVTVESLQAYRRLLKQSEFTHQISRVVDRGERIMTLDMICLFARLKNSPDELATTLRLFSGDSDTNSLTTLTALMKLPIDFSASMKSVNESFDSMLLIYSQPFQSQKQSFQKLEESCTTIRNEITSVSGIASLLLKSPQARGQTLAQLLITLTLPSLGKSTEAAERIAMQKELSILAIALEEYRLTHGKYPEMLSQLFPTLLTTIPVDRFTGEPLTYEIKEGQYKLHSSTIGSIPLAKPGTSLCITSPKWSE